MTSVSFERSPSRHLGTLSWDQEGRLIRTCAVTEAWGFQVGDFLLPADHKLLWPLSLAYGGAELHRMRRRFWLEGDLGQAGKGWLFPLERRRSSWAYFTLSVCALHLSHDLANQTFLLSALPDLVDSSPADELLDDLKEALPPLERFFHQRLRGGLFETTGSDLEGDLETASQTWCAQLLNQSRGQWRLETALTEEIKVARVSLKEWRRFFVAVALLSRGEGARGTFALSAAPLTRACWDILGRPWLPSEGWQLSSPLALSEETLTRWRGQLLPMQAPPLMEGDERWSTGLLTLAASLCDAVGAALFYREDTLIIWSPLQEHQEI